jgi:hypothetical protein
MHRNFVCIFVKRDPLQIISFYQTSALKINLLGQ